MTFDEWWATLTPAEHKVIGVNNAKFVWQAAQRKWVGLKAHERSELWDSISWDGMPEHDYGKAIEAKLRERNT